MIRSTLAVFLRFTHRYWFHEVSEQPQARELFRMTQRSLDNDRLYKELRDEIGDMDTYLDSDALRRQASTVMRLTVVTTFGLIGTIVTGFLGMNLIAAADAPLSDKVLYFAIVAVPVTLLTFYTVRKSQRLSDFLDALSDERIGAREQLGAFIAIFRGRRQPRD
jgi:Mg2+ and Co2+ transporter CorA